MVARPRASAAGTLTAAILFSSQPLYIHAFHQSSSSSSSVVGGGGAFRPVPLHLVAPSSSSLDVRNAIDNARVRIKPGQTMLSPSSRTALLYASVDEERSVDEEEAHRGFGGSGRQRQRRGGGAGGNGNGSRQKKRGRRGSRRKSNNNRRPAAQHRQASRKGDERSLREHYVWLHRATMTLLDSNLYPPGSLVKGKWHELSSMMDAWAKLQHDGSYDTLARASSFPAEVGGGSLTPPLIVEGLLKRLIDERTAGNKDVSVTTDTYNLAIESWASAAAAGTQQQEENSNISADGGRERASSSSSSSPSSSVVAAARRAQEILRFMQATYEATSDPTVKPNSHSFLTALGAWTRACSSRSASAADRSYAARSAHDLLLWMENIADSGTNDDAVPGAVAYSLAMDAYAKSGERDAGTRAESILRHLVERGGRTSPNTFCYNIVINAYTRQGRRGGAIDAAERILTEMESRYDETGDEDVRPDVVSYTSVISAWARADRKGYGAMRAENILGRMESIAAEVESSSSSSSSDGGISVSGDGFGDDDAGEDRRGGSSSNSNNKERQGGGVGVVVRPNTITYNAVLKAWSRSYDDRAPQRAEALFRRMEEQYLAGNPDVKPDRISFNTLLQTLAKGGKPYSAERILRRMEGLAEAGRHEWGPNLFSYNAVIEGWAKVSKRPDGAERAYAILRRLIARQTETLRPDSFSYNSVIFALSRSTSVPDAALRAEEILEHMEQARAAGNDSVKTDVFGYSSAIHAWSRSGTQGAGYRAEQILVRMQRMYEGGEVDLKPNTVTFNSVIDTWAKSGEGTLGARRAESLLRMMEDNYMAGDESVKPSAHSYNSVLSAWARSGTKCAHWKAEGILNRMWELYESGKSDVRPDGCSFNTLINAVSKSQREGKAQKALRILRRMDKLYKAGYKYARPNEFTYTSVLNSCAFTFVGDDLAKRKALDTAIFTLEELQESHYGRPNHVTYGMFLKACANLMSTDDERWRIVVEPVFLQCCRDGCVSGLVLSQLREAAPAELYNNLLGEVVDSDADFVKIQDLPVEWRCNVREKHHWKERGGIQQRRPTNFKRGAGKHQGKRIRAEPRLSP